MIRELSTPGNDLNQKEHEMGPLHGVKILEVAGIGPGPFAAMMLSDMGAEVLRVDRAQSARGGDPAQPPLDALTRGRRSVALDLKHPDVSTSNPLKLTAFKFFSIAIFGTTL